MIVVTPINPEGPVASRRDGIAGAMAAWGLMMKSMRVKTRADAAAERTASILVERHGAKAFDFAARQVALLHLADRTASADDWRAIAMEIERLTRTSH